MCVFHESVSVFLFNFVCFKYLCFVYTSRTSKLLFLKLYMLTIRVGAFLPPPLFSKATSCTRVIEVLT